MTLRRNVSAQLLGPSISVTRWRRITSLAIATSLAAYIALVVIDQRNGTLRASSTLSTLLVLGVAAIAFLFAAFVNERAPVSMQTIWLAALAFRITVAFTSPTLSDDVYRYIWDGHVTGEGVSPYAYVIEDPALDRITIPERDLANNPNLSSPYLPAAHAIFTATDLVLGPSTLSIRLVMIVFELGAAFLVVQLLVATGVRSSRSLLYLWNPLVIVEIAHGAHIDAAMTMLTLAALSATLRRPAAHWTVAPLTLAAATLTRPIPLLLVPIVWWLWSNRQRAAYAAVCAAAIAPFGLASGWGLGDSTDGTGVFGSARVYSESFFFNSATYNWLHHHLGGYTDDPGRAARIVAVIGMVVVLAAVAKRARDIRDPLAVMRLAVVPIAAYVLLTPILHPWYLVLLAALVPFLAPVMNEPTERWFLLAPWMLLMVIVPLSYLTYREADVFDELASVRYIEWLPTYGLLMVAFATSSRPPQSSTVPENISR